MKYFALLTNLGENLLAQATALGTKIELTHMAVGDGGGNLPTPDTNQTKLIREQRRAAINTLFIDEQNKNQIIAEQIIPEKDGGWWIREIGLFDKAGNLIAVANCPETYKPQLEEGSGRTQAIRMVLIVSHTESVTLKIDPSVVLATREYVDTAITVLDNKIDALSAQTKLDLTKKIDKANITHQTGNSTELVASQQLVTTEVGKKASKEELNNGLADKVSQSSIYWVNVDILADVMTRDFGLFRCDYHSSIQNAPPIVFGAAHFLWLPRNKNDKPAKHGTLICMTSTNQLWQNSLVSSKWQGWKEMLQDGSFGIGAPHSTTVAFNLESPNKYNGFYSYSNLYAGNLAAGFRGMGSFLNNETGFMIHGRYLGDRFLLLSRIIEGGTVYDAEVYHSLNTTKDDNGFLRTSDKTALTTGDVVQSTGTSTTNVMSQEGVTKGLNGRVSTSCKINGYDLTVDRDLSTLDIFKHYNKLTTENLNDIKSAGIYGCSLSLNATLERNYPVTKAGTLVVTQNGANSSGCTQEYLPFDENNGFRRSWSGSAWTTWANAQKTANDAKTAADNANNGLADKVNQSSIYWVNVDILVDVMTRDFGLFRCDSHGSIQNAPPIEFAAAHFLWLPRNKSDKPAKHGTLICMTSTNQLWQNSLVSGKWQGWKMMLQDGSFGIGTPTSTSVAFNPESTHKYNGFYSCSNLYSGNLAAGFRGMGAFYNNDNGFMIHGRYLNNRFLLLSKIIEGGTVYDAEVYHSLNTEKDRNGHLKVTGAVESSDCQVGVPLPWPQSTAPTGYLICNGQSFNKTTYPLLAKAYPSGILPDLRGEFIRGLDAGRNIDNSRTALSAQGDAMRNFTGTFKGAAGKFDPNYVTGVFKLENTDSQGAGYNGAWELGKVSFDPSRQVPTANENRPRNIAFLYIVRAA